MYYFQISTSIVLMIVLAGSLMYLILLSLKVATNRLSKRETMRKTFITTFCMWSSLFLLVIIWEDKSSWNITNGTLTLVMFVILVILLSIVSTVGLWLGKKKWKE